MNNIISIEDFILNNKFTFSEEQIKESLDLLSLDDEQLLEAWYNTILDFAALIPGIGSVAEGINLVSYAKQGEFLLAALCAIGLIPIFGQYIGAGGTLLVKGLSKGIGLGAGVLKPFINLIAKFFPKIVAFFKSSKFLAKFEGIAPFIGRMIKSLKEFVVSGGAKLTELARDTTRIRELKKGARSLKQGVKVGKWVLGMKKPEPTNTMMTPAYTSPNVIPVPQEVYNSYRGSELRNIRPYSDMEVSQSAMAQDWDQYI